MSDQYKVVFTGKLAEDREPEDIITAFAGTFKCSEEKARVLVMSGKATPIKSGLEKAKAEKYQAVLVAMGLEVELVAPQPAAKPAFAFEIEGDSPSADDDDSVSDTSVSACPKCGSKQVADDRCLDCKIVISKYLAIQESGHAFTAPAATPEKVEEAEESSPDTSSSSAVDYSAPADSSSNPYQAPEADLTPEYEEGDMTGPVSVSALRGWGWLTEGFGHFKQNPVAWIVTMIVWVILTSVLSFIPVIGSLAVTLLSPVISAGFMLGCREQEEGGDFRVAHLFSGFSSNVGQLVLVGLLYLVSMIVVIVVIAMFAGGAAFLLGDGLNSMGPDMASAMLVPILIGTLFIIPVVMAYWFAPALVALNDISAIAAMKMSFSACLKNMLPFFLYGLFMMLLFIIGSIPFGLGLLVVIPMIVASMYTSYRDIFYS
ncbi:BPSS1780 family membrane protein [Amphritea japonica]|uniref:Transmembrane protein n=1 Tax=Amphritea japonica ATCC BAA-1530 TaxID=1278309 RepID=A0A7R6P2E4_9GAMM|nr:BPSS1780 family membrane protein [Amphritea japonica]BBB25953.1 conserved hypothetical protein [Amphritea japonica ATCC BAA-1530]